MSRVKVRTRGYTAKCYLTIWQQITGRKENVEEAKQRILNQVEQYVSVLDPIVGSGQDPDVPQADETSEVLKIPRQYHPSLIGQNGKYVTRMEDRYGVKITFPREATEWGGGTRESLTPDEVLVKGGKKGVAGAKAELLDVSIPCLPRSTHIDGHLSRLSSSRRRTTIQLSSRFLLVRLLGSSEKEGPTSTRSRITPALKSMWTSHLRSRPQSLSVVTSKVSRKRKL